MEKADVQHQKIGRIGCRLNPDFTVFLHFSNNSRMRGCYDVSAGLQY